MPDPTLIHLYELNGSLADSISGPSLVNLGGSITSNGYVFGRDEGLSLTGALLDTTSYSIIIDITFNTLGPANWQKIIDFKNRSSDNGLYVYKSGTSHGVQFYPNSGIVGVVNKGVRCRFIITRASDNTTTTYVDNSEQFIFNDSSNMAVADSNFLLFCVDDTIVPNENDTGTIHRIEIYDGPLTNEILPTLFPTATPTETPTPTPTSTPTPTPPPECELPCFFINLTKISVDTWQGVDDTGNTITFVFGPEDLVISDEFAIEYWNKTIYNWVNYIANGVLTIPEGCIKIGGFCDSYIRKCIEISDQGFITGGQEGAKRRYGWTVSNGFSYEDGSPVLGCPWTIDGNKLRIDFENDGNCKKYNKFTQTSNCRLFYDLVDETEITIGWEGKGEIQDPCFDIMNLKINGALVAFAHAPGGGRGCGESENSVSCPNTATYTTTLNKGFNVIEIAVTTGDSAYHIGAYYEFTISPFSCCNCSLAILNVEEKEILEDGSKVYEITVDKNGNNCCNIEYKLSNGEWTSIPNENLDCSLLESEGKILATMLQNWLDCNAPTPTPTATPTPTPTSEFCSIGCNLDTWTFSSSGGGSEGKIEGLSSGAVRVQGGNNPLNVFWLLGGGPPSYPYPRGVTFRNGGYGGTLSPGNNTSFIIGEEVVLSDFPETFYGIGGTVYTFSINGNYLITHLDEPFDYPIPRPGGGQWDFYDLVLCCLPTPTPTLTETPTPTPTPTQTTT